MKRLLTMLRGQFWQWWVGTLCCGVSWQFFGVSKLGAGLSSLALVFIGWSYLRAHQLEQALRAERRLLRLADPAAMAEPRCASCNHRHGGHVNAGVSHAKDSYTLVGGRCMYRDCDCLAFVEKL
jgi:hypothetical protein